MAARIGVETRKTHARRASIQKANATPSTSSTGPRTSGRSPPFTAFCITVTSVVMRVTSEEVSK